MVKCPFCQYENEDGALFCEQCKSDLGADVFGGDVIPTATPLEGGAFEAQGLASAPLASVVGEEAAAADEARTSKPETAASAGPVDAASAAPPPSAFPSATSPTEAPAAAEPTVSPAAPGGADRLPPTAQPKLVVLRGLKINAEFPIYEGHNFIGRADEKPVDIDLEDQEPPDRIWSSRQHAVITFEDGKLIIEDLNSANGTFVNRNRIHPGQKRPLRLNDIVQIGTVQMKIKV